MVEIAQKGGEAVALSAVATAMGVSYSSLQQLAAELSRAGLITGFRGYGGGYRLAKPVYEISVLDIILAAEEGLVSPDNPEAQDLWDQLETCQYQLLQHISLADVASGGLRHHPVLKGMLKIVA
jgi:Rrf2 family iron-sulfur cluster assembly transcriptional regulator